MPDKVTNELLHSVLVAVQKRLDTIETGLAEHGTELRAIKTHLGALLQSDAHRDGTVADIQERIAEAPPHPQG
jgi:hypothetical protein